MIWLPAIIETKPVAHVSKPVSKARVATETEADIIRMNLMLCDPSYRKLARMTADEAGQARAINRKANQKLFWLWDHKLIRLPEGWR